MIISRTPFRISFFGGGTDYPDWYREHGGAVLGATIDKYCYLTCRYLPPFFEHRFRVVYSRIENCQTADEVAHPVVRAMLRYLGIERGLEIHHDGDLPARSGMGSSSAFTVGLLHALCALQGRMLSKEQLAAESIHLEQNVLRETVGSQDQVLAAYGGLNHIVFMTNGSFAVRPVTIGTDRLQELNDHLMLFFTGINRTASQVAQSYIGNVNGRRRELRILGDLVGESLSILNGTQGIAAFGELLNEAWQVKRSLSQEVSNAAVDEIYREATAAGAIGGKLLGAGGGGFMLLFVPPDRQPDVRARLGNLIHVPFKFEFTGTQIIFFDPEVDYSAEERHRSTRCAAPFRELATLPGEKGI
ncbi:MAG TPA: kinase [candidate division Zixibacteria bacterium]|nr:kinase [candidate division Zixibacteria bacterium]